jgi:hypothetical protein
MQLQNTLTLPLIRKSYVNIWRRLLRGGTSTRRLLNIPWFIAVAYLAMILHINPQSSTRTGTLPPLRVAPVAHIVPMVITTTTPEIRWRSERRGPIRKILSEIRTSRGTKRIETLGTPRTPKTRPLPTTTTTMMMVVTASSKARLRRIELFGVVVDLDLVRRAQDAPAEALAAAGFLVVHCGMNKLLFVFADTKHKCNVLWKMSCRLWNGQQWRSLVEVWRDCLQDRYIFVESGTDKLKGVIRGESCATIYEFITNLGLYYKFKGQRCAACERRKNNDGFVAGFKTVDLNSNT